MQLATLALRTCPHTQSCKKHPQVPMNTLAGSLLGHPSAHSLAKLAHPDANIT